MTPTATLIHDDCMEAMRKMPDASVDAIVTDPPYGLSFMGKRWDYDVPSVDIWAECLRVLKPGGHLLAFAGTRTQHRMAVRIEDAGFEIRDMIAWVYGSGFPKSLDVSKAIDKAAGVEFEAAPAKGVGFMSADGAGGYNVTKNQLFRKGESTEAARQWQGWGTALKPALEPITVARKPLCGTVAENVIAHGTGALNIDGCRVAHGDQAAGCWGNGTRPGGFGNVGAEKGGSEPCGKFNVAGRWPANLIHDGSEEVVGMFPHTTSGKPMNKMHTDPGRNVASGASEGGKYFHTGFGDSGSAARFFYCAKASKSDRDDGCDGMEEREAGIKNDSGRGFSESDPMAKIMRRNFHPTVKPTDLMRYLCRLVTPPGGVVLDPFMGSGSTGKAALAEGFNFIGIERDPQYFQIAQKRAQPPHQTTLPLP